MSAALRIEDIEAAEAAKRLEAVRRAGGLDDADVAALPGLPAALLGRLTDPDGPVRHAALAAIGQLAHREVLRFDGPAIAAVVPLARDALPPVRAEAAVALALLHDAFPEAPEIAPTLSMLLDDPEPGVRREAAAALGDVGAREARPALHRHLSDEDAQTRFESAFALATLGDAGGIDLLIAALDTGARRIDACEALRRLGRPEPIPVLEKLAKKFFIGWPERLTVLATLYSLGHRDAASALLERAGARNKQERALALGLIGRHQVGEGADLLRRVARDPRDPLRCTAVRALGDLGVAEDAAFLREIAGSRDAPLDVRLDAVEALVRLDAPEVASYLAELKTSPEPEVARAAEEALRPHPRTP